MPHTSFLQRMFKPQTVLTAVRIAMIVGTLLVVINYGDRIFLGSMHSNDWFKVVLTYMVPFFVSSYSSAKAQANND